MAKIQKRHIIDLPVYLSKLRSVWLNVIFYSKSNKRALTKPQLERQLAHAQTFDRGVRHSRFTNASMHHSLVPRPVCVP